MGFILLPLVLGMQAVTWTDASGLGFGRYDWSKPQFHQSCQGSSGFVCLPSFPPFLPPFSPFLPSFFFSFFTFFLSFKPLVWVVKKLILMIFAHLKSCFMEGQNFQFLILQLLLIYWHHCMLNYTKVFILFVDQQIDSLTLLILC